jgi:hypothetical protein
LTGVVILALVTVANAAAQTLATTNTGGGKTDSYETLITKLKAGETSIDYRALRRAYAERKDAVGAGSDHVVRRTMSVALAQKRFQDAIKIGEDILATVFISPDTHAALAGAYAELGDAKKAAAHKAIYLGLINSVLAEGNGETPATAYQVVIIEEPFAVVRALNLSVWARAGAVQNGKYYEVLSATDQKTGKIVKLHFNIDTPRAIQARNEVPKP